MQLRHERTAVLVSFAIDFWSRVCRSSRSDVFEAWYEETESDLTARKVGSSIASDGGQALLLVTN